MSRILKNREVRISLLLQLAVAVIAGILCLFFDVKAAIVAVVSSLCIVFIYLIDSCIRYRNISALAENVNKVLHGDNSISFDSYAEGELCILHSEIYKMTVRLREQQQTLLKDKIYLADSIADISHQIRTPLTSINLLVQLLSAQDLSEDRRQQLVRELYELLSKIDWLITTLLKISRLDTGTVQFKQEHTQIKTLIEKSCAPLMIPLELRDQTLSYNCEGYFCGDISWTCEAVGNIVKNCMEHTPKGGKIEILCSENALFSQIIIKDSGTGIAQEDLPHIFERFYKGKDSDNKSFGVGLALARMIITGQNGTVKAENDPQGGAVFTIRFYKGTV